MQLLSLNYGKNVIRSLLLALTLVVSQNANATIMIDYDLLHLGGTEYQYDYTLHVENGDPAFDLFSIYFSEFANVQYTTVVGPFFSTLVPVGSNPTGWGAEWFDFAPSVRFVDFFLDTATLTPGDIGLFSVKFDWVGAPQGAMPMSQYFEVYDFNLFDPVVASGQTQSVPEPGTLGLLLLGLFGSLKVKNKWSKN